jgi:hypothetical protein
MTVGASLPPWGRVGVGAPVEEQPTSQRDDVSRHHERAWRYGCFPSVPPPCTPHRGRVLLAEWGSGRGDEVPLLPYSTNSRNRWSIVACICSMRARSSFALTYAPSVSPEKTGWPFTVQLSMLSPSITPARCFR